MPEKARTPRSFHVCASCHSPSSPLSIPAVMLHISCNADSICTRSSMSNFTASQSFSHTWRAMKTASCSDRSDSSRAVFRSSTVYSPSCGGGTVPAPFFAGKFFSPITLQLLSPEMKSAYPWHTSQEHALTTADTKRAGSPTRSAGCLPSFCLFRAGFSYSVALMPPFCFRRQPFRQAVPPPFQPCRSWSFSRLAFRGWRGSGRNPWRCG